MKALMTDASEKPKGERQKALGVAVLAMLAGWVQAEPIPARTNVLMIIADDLRVELGCYGSRALTPNLDRLASRGLRFERAYCQQAVCNPSRSSFLTGKRPDTLRLWNNGTHFRRHNPEVITLPGWFKQHGYVTRNVGKVFHNWHTTPKGDRPSWSAPEFLHYANHGDDLPKIAGPLPPDHATAPKCAQLEVPDAAYFDGRVADEAVRVLAEVRDRPFFLAVGFWKPHAPFNAPKAYWDRYERGDFGGFIEAPPRGAPALAFHDSREILGLPPKRITLRPSDPAEMRHGYFANISYMDHQLGKVLTALEQSGVADNTVVVFLSDHGYHLGEHGLWAKTSCFELDARVPLLIAPPRAGCAGKKTAALAELVDLFPTLVDLCQLPAPAGLDGVSLTPVLADPAASVKPAALTQHPRPAYFDRTDSGIPDAMGYSLRTAKVRYTEWRDWHTAAVVARELYEHWRDPHELENRINDPTDPAALAEAEELLHERVPPGKRLSLD